MTTPPLPPGEPAVPDAPETGSPTDQEPLMPDHLALDHLALDDLADLAVGELPADSAAAVEEHLASVRVLPGGAGPAERRPRPGSGPAGGAARRPTMPVTVAARLDRVLAEEAATVVPFRRSAPLKAPASASYVKQTGVVRIMLAAAVAAAVVGFGGYVLSASAGLNEPSALSPTQVHPAALAYQARTLAENRDLDPHLFSAAWRCARRSPPAGSPGSPRSTWPATENYLVYTRSGGRTYADPGDRLRRHRRPSRSSRAPTAGIADRCATLGGL